MVRHTAQIPFPAEAVPGLTLPSSQNNFPSKAGLTPCSPSRRSCSKQLQGVWDTYRAGLFCTARGVRDTSSSKAGLTPCSPSRQSCSKQLQGVWDTYRAGLFCTARGVRDTSPSKAGLTPCSPSHQSPMSCNFVAYILVPEPGPSPLRRNKGKRRYDRKQSGYGLNEPGEFMQNGPARSQRMGRGKEEEEEEEEGEEGERERKKRRRRKEKKKEEKEKEKKKKKPKEIQKLRFSVQPGKFATAVQSYSTYWCSWIQPHLR
ncbi:hypothetical protein A6R68_00882 [Neotoma lepida]|uniref:Uncharacterized protein n=1 Tax=Neotoma lepida TaxID=56216 RepID=A0A1A6GXA7_NEOLE|nr:hypothetical protein A6R68_00882 [Neotoma lepida]